MKLQLLIMKSEKEKEYNREYYLKNKVHILEQTKKYRQLHPERKKESDRKWKEKNKKHIAIQSKIYVKNNYQKLKLKKDEYRLKNKEKINAQKREHYRQTHSPIILKYVELGLTKKEYKKMLDRKYYLKNKENSTIYSKSRYSENREHILSEHRKFIRFKDKRIKLERNPRSGICSECNFKGLTNMHHEKYDEFNPLAHTIELCVKCHTNKHPRLRDKHGVFI